MDKADILLLHKKILKNGTEYLKLNEYDVLLARIYGESYICVYKTIDDGILFGYCFSSIRSGNTFADKEMYKLCDIRTISSLQFANKEDSELLYYRVLPIDEEKAIRIKAYIESL